MAVLTTPNHLTDKIVNPVMGNRRMFGVVGKPVMLLSWHYMKMKGFKEWLRRTIELMKRRLDFFLAAHISNSHGIGRKFTCSR